jgi:hypothetical protein
MNASSHLVRLATAAAALGLVARIAKAIGLQPE